MLVTFTYGATPNVIRYTDWTSPVSLWGQVYASVPQMEVKLPANTIGLRENPIGIKLPLNAFTAALSIGEPHPFVDVEVREYIVGEADSLAKIMWRGRAAKSTRNFQGDDRLVRIEGKNIKSRLGVPLGIPATPTCQWTFGGKGCGVDTAALVESATITAIDRMTITTTGLTTTMTDRYFHRGFVEIDGLRIGVREYTTGEDLILVREPPRRWLGQVAAITPGCAKLIEVCRDTWDNEENFMGCGYAIPNYQPNVGAPL